MERGVLYLLEGTKLAARLVVSLWSLRKHYDGPAAIVSADPSAAELCELIARDPELCVSHIQVNPSSEISRHRGFVLKTLVNRFTPFGITAFLDCDTLVRGQIDELFALPTPEHIVVTQFCDWGTNRGVVRHRIRAWADLQPELITPALEFGRAVNTGVFSFTPRTRVFDSWYRIALTGQDRFIPDEIALQLLLPRFPCAMLDQRYNCSARFGNPGDPVTRIVHYHGRKHVGVYGGLWIRTYEEVVSRNVAGIQDWTPAADRQLRDYLLCTNGESR